MILNNKLVFDSNFYAVAKSRNDKKVCYINKNNHFDMVDYFSTHYKDCSFISLRNDPLDLYMLTYTHTYIRISTFLDSVNDVLNKQKDKEFFIVDNEEKRFFVTPIYYYKGFDNKQYCFSNHRFYLDSGDIGGKAGYFILSYDKYKDIDNYEIICNFCETLDLYCNGHAYKFTVYNQEDQENPIQQEDHLLHPCDFVSFINDYYLNLSFNDLSYKGQLHIYV